MSSSAFRSFLGHLRTHNVKEFPHAAFGPVFRRLPAGFLQPESRTLSRTTHTDNLLATYPWADTVDIKIFLMGFDAGEQFGRRIADIEHDRRVESA